MFRLHACCDRCTGPAPWLTLPPLLPLLPALQQQRACSHACSRSLTSEEEVDQARGHRRGAGDVHPHAAGAIRRGGGARVGQVSGFWRGAGEPCRASAAQAAKPARKPARLPASQAASASLLGSSPRQRWQQLASRRRPRGARLSVDFLALSQHVHRALRPRLLRLHQRLQLRGWGAAGEAGLGRCGTAGQGSDHREVAQGCAQRTSIGNLTMPKTGNPEFVLRM